MLARHEFIKPLGAGAIKKKERLTPAQHADAQFQVEAVYGLRAMDARQSQYDFSPVRNLEENTQAIQRQYATVTSSEKIRAHVEKLFRIIEKNKKKNIGKAEQYHQDAKLLETMSYIANVLKWFGDNAHITLTSLYDDITKGVDMVVEWKTIRNGKTHITRLGVDLTLLRYGHDADKNWKLEKKQHGGVMRDPESQQSILLDGALRHLDYFKSQFNAHDWRGKRFARTSAQGKKIISRRAGVFVPVVVASLENPMDLHHFCADLYDPKSRTIEDIEKDTHTTAQAHEEFAQSSMRIALLKATLQGVRAQMDSLTDQKVLYSSDQKIQDQIVKTLEEFRSIKKDIEKNILDAKGEVVVPIRRKEKTIETKQQDETRKNAFDALLKHEAHLKKYIQTFERVIGIVLPSDPEQVSKILYDTVLVQVLPNRVSDLSKINRARPFDAQYQKDQLKIQIYTDVLFSSDRQDFSFKEKLTHALKREGVARVLLEIVGLLGQEVSVRVA